MLAGRMDWHYHYTITSPSHHHTQSSTTNHHTSTHLVSSLRSPLLPDAPPKGSLLVDTWTGMTPPAGTPLLHPIPTPIRALPIRCDESVQGGKQGGLCQGGSIKCQGVILSVKGGYMSRGVISQGFMLYVKGFNTRS